jgi:hypothetical protein
VHGLFGQFKSCSRLTRRLNVIIHVTLDSKSNPCIFSLNSQKLVLMPGLEVICKWLEQCKRKEKKVWFVTFLPHWNGEAFRMVENQTNEHCLLMESFPLMTKIWPQWKIIISPHKLSYVNTIWSRNFDQRRFLQLRYWNNQSMFAW